MFLNVFHEKQAQTDVSKEMWVPDAKRFKHHNTVLNRLPSVKNQFIALLVWVSWCFKVNLKVKRLNKYSIIHNPLFYLSHGYEG